MKSLKNLLRTGISAIGILTVLSGNANPGILYSQEQTTQNTRLEEVVKKIGEKYPGKKPEYFSRGFIQFKGGEFIPDPEITTLIQTSPQTSPDNKHLIDGANLYDDSCQMIDSELHHIGDDNKDWFIIEKPEGLTYQKTFTINSQIPYNTRLGLEALFSDSGNKIYINNHEVGIVPQLTKSKWGKLLKQYNDETPFVYGEIDITEQLKQGENTIRIESRKKGGIFKKYDDFMIRRLQILYPNSSEDKEPETNRE